MNRFLVKVGVAGLFVISSVGFSFAVDENAAMMADDAKIMAKGEVMVSTGELKVSKNTAMDETQMSPEQQEMMGRMKEYSTPNENHQLLAKLAGQWTATVKMWMDPKGDPTVSEGTSNAKIILGGRFLHQDFKGSFMDQPFEGIGVWGYDNLAKKFKSIWYDNMATGIMIASGQYDAATQTITDEGTMSCPLTNGERWMKSVTKIIDADNYTYKSYMKDVKTQEEYLSMEIIYKRVN
jgi:hypothetical protein